MSEKPSIAGASESAAPTLTTSPSFVGFYAGDLSELPPAPPDIPDGWAVVGPDNDSVVDDLQAVIDTGVDSLVLIPFGPTEAQLTNFVREIAPRLRR